jgi:mono/diheme cytochrome c family protein
VHVVETNPFRKAGMLPLRPDLDPGLEIGTNGRGVPNALTSIAFSPDGRYAYVTAKKDNTARGLFRDGRPLTFETSVRAVACRLDLAAGKEDFAARVDIDNTSQPSDVAFTRSGSLAFVSTQGSNRVAALDPQGAPVIGIFRSPDFSGPTYAHLLGPVALALDARDSLLFVQYALSRELGVFDVSGVQQGGEAPRIALVKTVAKEALDPQVLFGKQIFGNSGDTRMSREGYTSCAACHMEGGTDGRVWDFTDRGEGLRRTTSLQGRAGTGMGPVHWSANFDEIQDFEHDIRGPFGGTGFMADADFGEGTRSTTLGDAKAGLSLELDALAAYVSSLAQVHPSPYRNPDGSLTDDGAAGRGIFQRPEVGCARCHGGPDFTDSRLKSQVPAGPVPAGDHYTPQGFLVHDVGTLHPGSGHRLNDSLTGFDTPTLKGIWEFGPYLHDGSAATLMDVITTSNPADKHGRTSHLTGREREQLVAYLRQIDDAEPGGVGMIGKNRGRAGNEGRMRLRQAWRSGFRFSTRIAPDGKPDYRDARGRHSAPAPSP